ncbi:hypothetical protein CV102_18950 [Natronococcus pandeyae]|uniref:Uncharacterized protein n=1 Tax=Natronococcus pandeyae TaxID=2055836 RepID=A0A8J8Q4L3_9EURY|nr:hypothetical protein [Natronococcus pandeyae]TYL37095.1 hypothetical protein CV102_18950 [Natronococcus pandeyae]
MPNEPSEDELEVLEKRVEALETQLDGQSSQLRRLWGVLLLVVGTIVLFGFSILVPQTGTRALLILAIWSLPFVIFYLAR